MEITGKIIAVLPERGGTSARTGSEWRVASYVLETMDQYPRKMNFEVFGVDRIQQFNIQLGEVMTVSFDVDAHEYNGRWFNSIRAFKVDRNPQPMAAVPGASPAQPVPPMPSAPIPSVPPTAAPAAQDAAPSYASNEGEDLPF